MKGKIPTGNAAPRVQRAATAAVLVFLLLASAAASLVKVFTGFDIDEAYALAMPYRVLQGDRLFADMWEVHQTSFFPAFLWMKLFAALTGGSLSGIVLYMRVVSTVFHFLVSLLVWRELRRLLPQREAVCGLLALGYHAFLPKWMMNMDFSMLQLWFFTLFAICLLRALESEGKRSRALYFAAGLMLALDVLSYPGMVVLYPVTALLLLLEKKRRTLAKGTRWLDVLWLTLGCLLAAAVFLAGVLSYMTPGALLAAVPRIFMDGSHQYDPAVKLGLYASQWGEALLQAAVLCLPALALTLIGQLLWRLLAEKTGKAEKELPFGLLFCVVFEAAASFLIIAAWAFVSWGPFRLQVRYLVQLVMAYFLYNRIKKEKNWQNKGSQKLLSVVKWLLWMQTAAFAGILVSSNVGPVSSASYLVAGNLVFAALTMLCADVYKGAVRGLSFAAALLFVLSLLMCKGYYMRSTEYVPGDVGDGLTRMEEGPLAGIYVRNEEAGRYQSDYETIQAETKDDDRVLFMGTEGLGNLYANGRIVTPTTISTPAFNRQWVDYFDLYPQKQPTVIFLAKNTVDNREKFFAKNEFGRWIAARYDVDGMKETDSLCIIRKRGGGTGQ